MDPDCDSANVPLRAALKNCEWWVRRLFGKIQETFSSPRPTVILIAVVSSRLKPNQHGSNTKCKVGTNSARPFALLTPTTRVGEVPYLAMLNLEVS